jgi:hypothetical protein
MTEKDFYIVIGIKESEIYTLSNINARLTKDLEAVRAQLEELARDRNDTLQSHLPA